MSQIPLLSFNSKSVDWEDLEKTLIGRKEVVDEIFNELKEKIENGETYQSLLIACRGSGKTHLTKILYSRINNSAEIRDKVVIAYMVEDEYGISNFSQLLVQILEAIKRYDEYDKNIIDENLKLIYNLPFDRKEIALKKFLLDIIADKKLIILLENFNVIIDGLKKEAAKLRDIIHEKNNICLINTSQSLSPSLKDSKYPFYHFFRTRYLEGLTSDQAIKLIEALISIEKNPSIKQKLEEELKLNTEDFKAKIRAIHDLSKGNHRLITHFYQFLRADIKTEFAQVFIKQMNDLKSYYEQFIKDLSYQQQKIIQIITLNRIPISATDISTKAFLEVNTVTKQLSELFKMNYVTKHKIGKEALYEINEPLMRICFEINENPDGAVSLFVTFLKSIYSERELQKKYFNFEIASQKYTDNNEINIYRSEAEFYKKAINQNDPLFQKISKEIQLNSGVILNIEDYIDESEKQYNSSENNKNIGYELIMKGQYDDAIEAFKKLLNIETDTAFALGGLGAALRMKGQYDEAIEAFKKLLNIEPDSALALGGLGDALRIKGQHDDAIEAFKKLLNIEPDSAFALNSLGNALVKKGQYDDAIEAFNNSLNIELDSAYALTGLGDALSMKGQYYEAIEAFNKSLNIKSDSAHTLSSLGEALRMKGQYDEAIEAFNKSLNIEPDSAYILRRLGEALTMKGQYNDAIEAFNKSLNMEPDSTFALRGLGVALRMKGQYDDAIEAFNKSLNMEPDSAFALNSLGYTFGMKGQYDDAIEAFNKSLNMEPDSAFALSGLGEALRMKEQYEDAIEAFNKSLNIESDSAYALRGLGEALRKKGQYDEAIGAFNKSLNMEPDSAFALRGLGEALRMKGQYDEAIEAFNKSLNMEPDSAFALNSLGYTFEMKGQYDEAIEAFNKSLNIEPESTFALDGLGYTFRMKEQFDDAIEAFNKSLNIEPDSTYALRGLGEALRMKGQYDDAIEAFNKSLNLEPDSIKYVLRTIFLDTNKKEFTESLEFISNLNLDIKYKNQPLNFLFENDHVAIDLLLELSQLLSKLKSSEQKIQIIQSLITSILQKIRTYTEDELIVLIRYINENLIIDNNINLIYSMSLLDNAFRYVFKNEKRAIFELPKEERELLIDLIKKSKE